MRKYKHFRQIVQATLSANLVNKILLANIYYFLLLLCRSALILSRHPFLTLVSSHNIALQARTMKAKKVAEISECLITVYRNVVIHWCLN